MKKSKNKKINDNKKNDNKREIVNINEKYVNYIKKILIRLTHFFLALISFNYQNKKN